MATQGTALDQGPRPQQLEMGFRTVTLRNWVAGRIQHFGILNQHPHNWHRFQEHW